MFDSQSDALPTGDNFDFWGYLKRPKYWCLCLSGFGVIGVCYAMESYDAFTELQDDEGFTSQIFWLCDMLGRFIGALLAFMMAKCINEYIWAIVYSAMGFLGVILIFAMTMTDKVNREPAFVWVAVCLLGVATGGWWQMGAQTVLDDSGFGSFATKWGLIVTLNYLGMFFGGLFLANFEMDQRAAIGFLVMTLIAIVASVLALLLDVCRDSQEDKKKLNNNKNGNSDK